MDIISREEPTHLAVAFDTSEPTQRHVEFADYKAQREEAAEALTEAQASIDKGAYGRPVRGSQVVTRLEPAGDYWLAEDYHQHYVAKGGACHF